MDTIPRGFKLKTIIDRFAWELLLIFRESFVEDSVDLEHLKLRILMTLSDVCEERKKMDGQLSNVRSIKSYRSTFVRDLLFRDYSADKEMIWHTFDLPATETNPAQRIRIHDESITYLSNVLERRLTLAQNLKEKPTNLHLLFVLFSSHSKRHLDWKSATVLRHKAYNAANDDHSHISDCARKLADQRIRLGEDFSDISHRRREQYGPYWLVIGDCKTEIAEELSLFDALEAIPLALNSEFFHDSALQKALIRVINSLNERYKLLRSAGLAPQVWLERDYPSIAVLRDLKHLRVDADSILSSAQAHDVNMAYRLAFNAKKTAEQKKKIAGCFTFNEFSRSDYGQAMLKYTTLSLDQPDPSGSYEHPSMYEAIAGSDFENDMIQSVFARLGDDFDWVQYLIDTRPDLFDDVMTIFFQEVIAKDHPITASSKDQSLLKNAKFKDLIHADPCYKNLSDEALTELLIEKASDIIDQGIQSIEQPRLRIVNQEE